MGVPGKRSKYISRKHLLKLIHDFYEVQERYISKRLEKDFSELIRILLECLPALIQTKKRKMQLPLWMDPFDTAGDITGDTVIKYRKDPDFFIAYFQSYFNQVLFNKAYYTKSVDRETDKNNTIEDYGKYLPYDADTLERIINSESEEKILKEIDFIVDDVLSKVEDPVTHNNVINAFIDSIGCNKSYRKRLYKIRKCEKVILTEIMEDVRECLMREITG